MAKKSCKRNRRSRRYRGGVGTGLEKSTSNVSNSEPSAISTSAQSSSWVTSLKDRFSSFPSSLKFWGGRRTKRHRKKPRSYKGGDGLSYEPASLASTAAEFNGSGGRRRKHKRRGTKKQRGGFLDEPEEHKNKDHTGGFLNESEEPGNHKNKDHTGGFLYNYQNKNKNRV